MLRQFNRQMKKLYKLRDRSDIELQQQKAAKYDKRAKTGLKIAGVGAAIAGAGAAAEYGGANLKNKLVSQALAKSRQSQWDARDLNSKQHMDEWTFWENQRKQLDGTELGDWNRIYDVKQQQSYDKWKRNDTAINDRGLSERESIRGKAGLASQINKGVMIAGAGVATVGAGVAAYNKIRSTMAKRRTTDAGHAKAVQKYKQQYEKMINKFQDTPYSELIKEQNRKNKNSIRS